jgi:hypothetical protein
MNAVRYLACSNILWAGFFIEWVKQMVVDFRLRLSTLLTLNFK